jgi:hydrogenase maturation protease
MRRQIVIGMGNGYRSDDAAGLCVARRIGALGLEGVTVYEDAADAFELAAGESALWTAILADAVCSGAPPGTVFRFDARRGPIPERLFPRYSTHGLGVAATIDLIRLVDHLLEAASLEHGQDLSPIVFAACDRVVRRIVLDLSRGAR